jgi:hypothetical protein
MAEQPVLVILAAGRGSRFGGLKQLEPVGPGGEAILDYTVYDALRAGFGRVVLVVSEESEDRLRSAAVERFGRHLPVDFVCQRIDDLPDGCSLPPGRVKPWGTGQAVLAARHLVDRPFAAVNADDFYGAGALESLGRFLAAEPGSGTPVYAMVGYGLGATLPDDGNTVSRALCRCTRDGWLEQIEEIPAIARFGDGGLFEDTAGQSRQVGGDELVSMNIWGFTPAIFPQLNEAFGRFLEHRGDSAGDEFYLSNEVNGLIAGGAAKVKVLGGAGRWCGITNPEDKARVAGILAGLTDQGDYPRELWK